jgi:hypothetical protein
MCSVVLYVLSSLTHHQTFFSRNSRSCCFQNLELINLQAIGSQAFDYIVHSSNLSRLYVVLAIQFCWAMLDKLSNKLDLTVLA